MKPKARGLVEGLLPPSQRAALETFHQLLATRAVPLGFVSPKDRDRLWDRHLTDSLRALPCLPPTGTVLDLGSGAGLPGIPLAICRPDLAFVLVEPKARRAAFLELAVADLSLANIEVAVARAEGIAERAEACLARALAGPEEAWAVAEAHLAPGGYLLYWAGRTWGEPGTHARAGVATRICDEPQFPWQGPVVIMSRN